MAVKIRLMRVGKKKQPTYRVVVADSRSPRDGRFIEIIGQYAPRSEPSVVSIDTEKAVAWLQKGAQPTDQVARLLDDTGVWDAYKTATGRNAAARPKARPATPKAKAAAPEAPVPAAAEPVAEEAPAETDAVEVEAVEVEAVDVEAPAVEAAPVEESSE